jgi:Polysaccharide biosynthesis enzyme WcbI
MERVVVVGNCQAASLEMLLATNERFSERFEFVSFPPVHEIPAARIPELHAAVASAAAVIPQRVDEDYRDGLGLGTDTLARLAADTATVVRWPSMYWAGYVPDLFYLRDAAGQPIVDGPFDYHDRVILQAYADGLDAPATRRLLADPDRPSDAPAWAAKASAELEIRGRDCDVQIAALIAERFREQLLFFTMNHPTNLMLGLIAQQITELIGIPGRVDHRRIPDEILGATFYPLHANHVRALDLRLGAELLAGQAPFRIRWSRYEPEQAVQAFFDYYAAHPRLVDINVAQHAA